MKNLSASDNRWDLLDPEVLSRISGLTFQMQTVISSMTTGMHRSSYHGSSIEFSEHRVYSEGDEPKWIDWKIYAKTDKYYVKQFENESNLKSYLLVDASASMQYNGDDKKRLSKLQYANILLASLAYVFTKQRDSVGLVVSSPGEEVEVVPAGWKEGQLGRIINRLENVIVKQGSGLGVAIARLAENVKKKGVVIIASDLFDDEKFILQSLKRLKQRKQHVILLHILDPFELTFPFEEVMEMFDSETSGEKRMIIEPSRVRERYRQELESYLSWWRNEALAESFDYHLVDTSLSLSLPLSKILKT